MNNHIQTFEEFVNESNVLNEMPMNRGRGSSNEYSVLSIGSLNINTGKSKYFNVYDTYDDSTAEIYKDVSSGSSSDKFKIVFTSGNSVVKAGDKRAFKDDQRGTPLFVGDLVESCSINDLKTVAAKLGIKSCIAYTYK
jgi:hypothetical protein